MFLVMGITGKVGGATAEHLLAHRKDVRALVRNREKAANWANKGVELVEGDWNDPAAIEQALGGVEGAFVMLPPVWAPSPDYKEAKGVIANYVEALTKAAPPRVVALSSMGANRTSGHGVITALSLLEQGLRDLKSPIAFARRRVLRKLPLRLAGRRRRNATGLLQSDKPEIDHGRDERHRRGGRIRFDRAGVVRAARHRGWFDGHRR
ncbi:NAD(P)H-binding protein [Mesorhizobium sp. BR1-1-11]|uniref:NAD(P)H-binding protein n=1 Tax=Mesorhizobium sp. BR1-1-11 TaxID=2876658 RepID=UPI001CD11500|nr:NAD(P)H-binding protein [Mesorhizobium sp. BR1-1-11]MBZ9948695.1 NAD(P)H-binding protein [Mesorhizobium sp. BR1-1-11]